MRENMRLRCMKQDGAALYQNALNGFTAGGHIGTEHVNMVERQVSAIVLAAGLSTRMGAFKPLLRLGGKLLIQLVIEALERSGEVSSVVVVTGHQRELIEEAVSEMRVRTVFNAEYAKGEMLSSLQKGIGALPVEAHGFVLAFADQPAVEAETVGTLVRRFKETGAPLVIPEYLGKRGHPVVISTALVPAIRALPPEGTLRTVVHEHLARAEMVTVNDASVLEDLDTPEDFIRLEKRWSVGGNDSADGTTFKNTTMLAAGH